jgi:hypothetical protein
VSTSVCKKLKTTAFTSYSCLSRGRCFIVRKLIFGSDKIKSFLVQQFFKNAAEVKGEEPLSSPAGDETPRAPKKRKLFKGTMSLRTCVHRFFVRIFRHKFIADKAKLRRRAVARQVILTQYALNFAKKTYIVFYEHKFFNPCQRADTPFGIPIQIRPNPVSGIRANLGGEPE